MKLPDEDALVRIPDQNIKYWFKVLEDEEERHCFIDHRDMLFIRFESHDSQIGYARNGASKIDDRFPARKEIEEQCNRYLVQKAMGLI